MPHGTGAKIRKRTTEGSRGRGLSIAAMNGEEQAWPDRIYYGLHDELQGRVITKVYQDMTRPMTDYWISAGHNSYLVGKQIGGRGSVGIIAEALILGNRSIELDCYPPDGKGCGLCKPPEPGLDGGDCKVDHEGGLTKNVRFTDCIMAIKQAAFLSTKYPLTLNISGNPREKKWWDHMARVMTKIFGASLYSPDEVGNCDAFSKSPAQLVGKIIIRTKMHDVRGCEDGVGPWGSPEFAAIVGLNNTSKIKHPGDLPWLKPDENGKPPKHTSFSLAETAVKHRHFDTARGEAGLQQQQLSLWRDVKDNIVRVYPSGLRVGSSNYDPWPYWMIGAQMAALNWQDFDCDIRTNLAFFRDNGACGYVLKPEWLRNPTIEPSDRGGRQYTTVNIGIFGITTARYTGSVKIDLQIWGLREQFENFDHIKGVSELVVAKTHVKRPQLATKFDFQAVMAEICLEVGTIVIEVKMGSNTEYGLLPTRDLRPGRHLIQLVNKQSRVSEDLHRNNYIAVNFELAEARDGTSAPTTRVTSDA